VVIEEDNSRSLEFAIVRKTLPDGNVGGAACMSPEIAESPLVIGDL